MHGEGTIARPERLRLTADVARPLGRVASTVGAMPGATHERPRTTLVDRDHATIDIDRPASVLSPLSGLLPGDTPDQFSITEVIGAGGMGTVYRAYDRALERDVAIKVIHEDMVDRASIREAFAAEARAMASVRHPNVVTIHAFGNHGRQPYLVMEYFRGISLAAWRDARRVMDLGDALAILDSLCRGVTAIHEAGTLHRDLKPGNVLVEPGGRVAVTDFGLARPAEPRVRTREGRREHAFGTPAYVAPEVAREEIVATRLAARADVYALGVIAFELLTGTRPFAAASIAGMLHDHAYTPPPRPSHACPELPAVFDDVLLRALTKSPEARTPSAESLRSELTRAHESVKEFPRGLRILAVDDDAGTLVAVRELLLDAFPGAHVSTVTNPKTAAKAAMRSPPDILITDLHMPDGGAGSLIARLRAEPRTATVPIIVVTGHGGAEEWRALRALGADRFLVKPVDFDALAAMIRATLRAPAR